MHEWRNLNEGPGPLSLEVCGEYGVLTELSKVGCNESVGTI